jgi:hypothetical protein
MRISNPWIYVIVITAIVALVNKNKIINYVWDKITQSRINGLHPAMRKPVTDFINKVESQLGIKLRITRGLASFDEQAALYAQGRTKPGPIVTNAQAGKSFHNYGLAFDVVEIKNGKANWNTDWNAIADIGKNEYGFYWGGDFKSLKDNPHFQKGFGNDIDDLFDKYTAGDFVGEYVNLS